MIKSHDQIGQTYLFHYMQDHLMLNSQLHTIISIYKKYIYHKKYEYQIF